MFGESKTGKAESRTAKTELLGKITVPLLRVCLPLGVTIFTRGHHFTLHTRWSVESVPTL